MALYVTMDFRRVLQMSDTLLAMKQEFDNAEQVAHDYGQIVGSPVLARQLEEFAGNWRFHRQQLGDHLQGLSDHAKEAAHAFAELDKAFADALQQPGAEPSPMCTPPVPLGPPVPQGPSAPSREAQ